MRVPYINIIKSHDETPVRMLWLLSLILLAAMWGFAIAGRDTETTIMGALVVLISIPCIVSLHKKGKKLDKELRYLEMRLIAHTEIMKILDEEQYDKMLEENPDLKARLGEMGLVG